MLYIQYPSWIHPEVIPGLPVRWYGVMYLIAFVVTYLLFNWQIKKKKLDIPSDLVLSMFFWAILGLLIGARIFAATIYDPTRSYISQPWLIFWPFDQRGNFTGLQGMSFHGGLIGCLISIIIFLRVKKQDFALWGDMLVEAVPLGYTFGRLGNFINGELYGKVSDAPWAILFPQARPVPAGETWAQEIARNTGIPIPDGTTLINLPRHPSQLYEALFEGLILWLILWFIFRKHKPFKGFSIGVYMIGYSVFRFMIEYFREPDPGLEYVVKLGPKDNPPQVFQSLLNFSTGQILNFIMLAGGILIILIFKHQNDKRPRTETFLTATDRPGKNDRRKLRKKLK